MKLRDLCGEEGSNLLPIYVVVSAFIHILILLLFPYPLKVKITEKIPVILMERTSLRLVPKVELEKGRFFKGILEAERLSSEMEKSVFSPRSVPPPMELPVSTFKEAKEFLGCLVAESVKTASRITFPAEVVPPEKLTLNPDRIPLYIPEGVLGAVNKEMKEEISIKRGPLEFTGPVTRRELIFFPPLPKVIVKERTVVFLKFWVDTDGSVSMVRLMRVDGDPNLGPVAFRYIKGLRFNSVPESAGPVWGRVKVRFEVSR